MLMKIAIPGADLPWNRLRAKFLSRSIPRERVAEAGQDYGRKGWKAAPREGRRRTR
jgi:hypothetical protein